MKELLTLSSETIGTFTNLNVLEFNEKLNNSTQCDVEQYRHLISIMTVESEYIKNTNHSLVSIDMSHKDSPQWTSALLRLSREIMSL